MRRLLPLLVSLSLVAGFPAIARAHEIQVVPVGSGEVDAGLADPARLIHATLDAPGDRLDVTVRSTGAPLELLLLVPDRKPESAQEGADLPTIDVRPKAVHEPVESGGADQLVDEGTAIEYRVIGTWTSALRAGVPVTVTIRRGDQPTRVALRIGAPTSFEAADVERTPRTLVKLRGWVETPAPSAKVDRTPTETTSRGIVAIYGAGIALLGVLIGVWWVWSGRRRSRERGAERAAGERRS